MNPNGKTPGMFFIFITMLLDIVGMGIIIPIMPQLVAQFVGGDLSNASRYYGLLMALFTLMQFLFAPLLGALSDRFGRKPILLLSLLGTAISYLMTALAPSMAWLYASRLLGGFAGASLTVASAYIADVSTNENRAQNFGMVGAAFGLGFIIGPALGGLLGSMGAQIPFYLAAFISLLNFAYGVVGVPESHRLENRRAVTWERANPFSWIPIIRKHPLLQAMLATLILNGLAQNCQHSNWVLFTTLRFHWTPGQNGASLAVVGICATIVQGGLIRLILPKLGERRAILYGLGLGAFSFLLYGLATQGWMMYVVMVGGSLSGIAGPALQGLISRQVGPDEQGTVQGALTSLMSLTGIISPLVANYLFAAFTGVAAPVQIPGIAFFLGAFLAALGVLNMRRLFARFSEPRSPRGVRPINGASEPA